MNESDQLVDDFLSKLERELSDQSPSQRAEIVSNVAEHIKQARAERSPETAAATADLLRRLGSPEEIAASAQPEGGQSRSPLHRHRRSVAIGSLVAILAVGAAIALFELIGGSTRPSMPNVIGLSEPRAVSTLSSAGITRGVDIQEMSSLASVNSVFATSLAPGAAVAPGQSVVLSVSTGPSSMPDLEGATATAALQRLNALGLRWVVVRSHQPAMSGKVVGQNPAPGTRLKKQTFVEVLVGSASTEVPKEAPYLLGTPGKFAVAELRSLGFRVRVRYFRGGLADDTVNAEGPLGVPVGNRPVYIGIRK